MKTIVPSFTEPSATNNNRGSPNNNAINFPEVYESLVHKKATRPCFFHQDKNQNRKNGGFFCQLQPKHVNHRQNEEKHPVPPFLVDEIFKTSFLKSST